jgi:hypothetical protein
MSNSTQSIGFPSLTPVYGLGSGSRTGASILISAPRNRIGSQGRIYNWMKNNGQGPQYINYLLFSLGNQPARNGWDIIST